MKSSLLYWNLMGQFCTNSVKYKCFKEFVCCTQVQLGASFLVYWMLLCCFIIFGSCPVSSILPNFHNVSKSLGGYYPVQALCRSIYLFDKSRYIDSFCLLSLRCFSRFLTSVVNCLMLFPLEVETMWESMSVLVQGAGPASPKFPKSDHALRPDFLKSIDSSVFFHFSPLVVSRV